MAVERDDGRFRVKGWHVLAMMLGFFAVVFAVNGWFLYSALSTHAGVVSNEPYRKGLAYNERIAADERQKSLGWKDETSLAGAGDVTVRLTRDDGSPVQGLNLSAVVGRPATITLDQRLVLVEGQPGVYAAKAKDIGSGTWVVSVEAHGSDGREDPIYRARRRLWVKP